MKREGWMYVFLTENEDGSKTFSGGSIHKDAECASKNGASLFEASKLFGPVYVEFDDETGATMLERLTMLADVDKHQG